MIFYNLLIPEARGSNSHCLHRKKELLSFIGPLLKDGKKPSLRPPKKVGIHRKHLATSCLVLGNTIKVLCKTHFAPKLNAHLLNFATKLKTHVFHISFHLMKRFYFKRLGYTHFAPKVNVCLLHFAALLLHVKSCEHPPIRFVGQNMMKDDKKATTFALFVRSAKM